MAQKERQNDLANSGNSPSLWPAFSLGLAVAIGNGFARFAYALLLPAMRQDLAWTYTQAGWLNTANALGYVAGAAACYLLLLRYRPGTLFIVGLWGTVLTLLATGLFTDARWLTAIRLLSGLGAAFVFSCGGALIAARYGTNASLRGTAMGVFFAGAGLGVALSGLAIPPLLVVLGPTAWPWAWGMLGGLALILSPWPFLEARRIKGVGTGISSTPLSLRGGLASLVGYFVFAAGYIIYMTFIFAWLRTQGLSWPFATTTWILMGLGISLSPFAWKGPLSQWPPTRTLSASCLFTLIGTLIPLGFPSPEGVLASAFIFGLGVFIAPSAIAVLVRAIMPVENMAKGMTLFTIVFSVGQAIGPILAGWVADQVNLNAALGVGAGLLGISVIVPWFERQSKRCRMASVVVPASDPHRTP